jgi:hypothetical protein
LCDYDWMDIGVVVARINNLCANYEV